MFYKQVNVRQGGYRKCMLHSGAKKPQSMTHDAATIVGIHRCMCEEVMYVLMVCDRVMSIDLRGCL